MLNTFYQKKQLEVLKKECIQDTHSISFLIEKDKIVYCQIYTFSPPTTVTWYPDTNVSIMVYKNNNTLELPYFEPDFSNYPSLLNKIKTYMVLS